MVRPEHDNPTGDGAAIDLEHLRQVVHTRVFGATDPVVIGRYDLGERIGSGAMGVVYAAHDRELDRPVALKVLRSGGQGVRERLVREAQALARVSHPNVVHIYEVGEHGSEVFLAMELVAGTPLRAWLHETSPTTTEIIARFVEVGRGLAAAHAHGVVHRDVKPDNIVVGDDGRARIVDFGLAVGVAEPWTAQPGSSRGALAANLTQTGQVLGTPAYMPPEQMRGDQPDPKADQFAWCVSLFEALTGALPFAVDLQLEADAPPRDRIRWPKVAVADRVRKAIARGLSSDPAARFDSMDALLERLSPFAPSRRRRLGIVAAGVGAGSVALATFAPVEAPSASAALALADADTAAELVVARARALLATDPTAAFEELATLPDDSPGWRNHAWPVAAGAWEAGVAETVTAWDGPGELVAAPRGDALVADLETCALTLIGTDGDVRWRSDAECADNHRRARRVNDAAAFFVRAGRLVHTNFDETWDRGPAEASTRALLARSGDLFVASDTTLSQWRPGAEAPVVVDVRDAVESAGLGPGRLRSPRFASVNERYLQVTYVPDDEAGRVGLLDTQTGRSTFFSWNVVSIRTDSDGRGVTQHRDGHLEIWDGSVDDGRVVEAASLSVGSAVVGPDGGWTAAVEPGRGVVVWAGEPARRVWFPWPDVTDLLPSPDGTRIALVAGGDLRVVTPTGQIVRTLRQPHRTGMPRWSDADTLVTRSGVGDVRRWTIPRVTTLDGHRGGVDAAVFAGTDRLVSAGRDRTIALWDLTTGARTELVDSERGDPTVLDASADGSYVVVSFLGGRMAAWSLESEVPVAIEAPVGGRGDGRIVDNESVVFTRGANPFAWNLRTATERRLTLFGSPCALMDVTPGGWLAARCDDVLHVKNLHGGQERSVPSPSTMRATVDPTGTFALTASWTGSTPAALVDLTTGRMEPLSSADAFGQFHPLDRRYLARDGRKLHDRRTDVALDRMTEDWDIDMLSTLAMSPDGKTIAYGTQGGELRLRSDPVRTEPDALRRWVHDNQPHRR